MTGSTKKTAELHIWDTLGQEKFHSIANVFFKGSAGAFLVFDLSTRKSFEDLEKWYEVMENSIDTQVVKSLLGNKCDLPNREVTYNEAQEWA